MLKRTIMLTTFLAVLFLGGLPVDAASLKIGLIDTQRVLRESKVVQTMRQKLLDQLNEKRAVFSKQQAAVLEKEAKLKVEQSSLPPEELRQRQIELAQEVKNLGRLKVDLEEELERSNNEFTARFVKDLRQVVSGFQKEKDYTLILEKGNVVASDDGIDITDDIIRLYDKKGTS